MLGEVEAEGNVHREREKDDVESAVDAAGGYRRFRDAAVVGRCCEGHARARESKAHHRIALWRNATEAAWGRR